MNSKTYKIMSVITMALVFGVLVTFAATGERSDADGGTTGAVDWSYDNNILSIWGNGDMGNYGPGDAPWYAHQYDILSIEIYIGVTSIGDYTFYDCINASSVSIPDSVISIGEGAFYGCNSLGPVTIEGSVGTIGYRAFYGSAITNLEILGDVGTIGSEAFSYSGLTTLEILGNIGSIGSEAFSYSGLTNLEIQKNVGTIGQWAFTYSDITTLEIQGDVGTVEKWAFQNSAVTTLEIQGDVGTVEEWAFQDSGITTIEIRGNVGTIGTDAFEYASYFTTLRIQGNVGTIGYGAFALTPITTLYIQGNVGTIDGYAFYMCGNLESFVIGGDVGIIGVSAFNYSALVSVAIPPSLTWVGDYAFSDCPDLTIATIPDSVSDLFTSNSIFASASPQFLEIYYTGADLITASQTLGTVNLDITSYSIESVTVGTTRWASDIPVSGAGNAWSFDRGANTKVYVSVLPVYYELELTAEGAGKITYSYNDGSPKSGEVAAGTTLNLNIKEGTVVSLTAVNGTDLFQHWSGDLSGPINPNTVNVDDNREVTAVFATPIPPVPVTFTISASSDAGSTITPTGSQAVLARGSITFVFSAKAGYVLTDVRVDGVSYFDLIDAGSYTFYDVTSGHTITVLSSDVPQLTLTVNIVGGDGYAEYHIGASSYTRFTRTVNIAAGSDVYVKAVPSDGYEFVNWSGGSSGADPELHVNDLESSIVLTANLRATDGGGDNGDNTLLIAVLAIIIVIVILLLLLFLLRKSFEVTKIIAEDITVIGKDKARRNRPYRFSVEGDAETRYRIGDGEWRSPISEGSGNFTIPGKDVIDVITIEVT